MAYRCCFERSAYGVSGAIRAHDLLQRIDNRRTCSPSTSISSELASAHFCVRVLPRTQNGFRHGSRAPVRGCRCAERCWPFERKPLSSEHRCEHRCEHPFALPRHRGDRSDSCFRDARAQHRRPWRPSPCAARLSEQRRRLQLHYSQSSGAIALRATSCRTKARASCSWGRRRVFSASLFGTRYLISWTTLSC